jgi:hypothetical protein
MQLKLHVFEKKKKIKILIFASNITLHLDVSYVFCNILRNLQLLVLMLVVKKCFEFSFKKCYIKNLKNIYHINFMAFDI